MLATGRTAEEISHGENDDVHWICPVYPQSHHWKVSPLNRVTGGTGCPECMTHGSSAQEVRVAFELAAVLNFDPTLHTIRTDNVRSVDMVAPELGLVIEFDGSYWHKNRESLDGTKSQALRKDGWTVVRIREAPLQTIDPQFDVVVPHLGTPFEVALRVLEHLAGLPDELTKPICSAEALRDYRIRGVPLAAREAERHLLRLRSKKAR